MVERIQQIMEYLGVKPGEFAEQIGINRSAISHILNGRNKPSLEVVNKILSRYDYINSDWLLFGKGDMLKKEILSSNHPKQPSLFDQVATNPTKTETETKYHEDNQPKSIQNIPQQSVNELKEIRIPTTKKITKLVIFYSDNTFDTFAPDKGMMF